MLGFAKRFTRDQRGTVAVIFSIVAIPVTGIAACAIDYGRASSTRTQLQRAVDAAAAEAQGQLHLEEAALRKLVRAHVAANLPESLKSVPVEVEVPHDRRSLSVSMETTVPTTLMSIAGIQKLDVVAKAEVQRRQVPLGVPPTAPVVPVMPELPGGMGGAGGPVADLVGKLEKGRLLPPTSSSAPMPPPRPIGPADIAAQIRGLEQLTGGRAGTAPTMSEKEVAAELGRVLEALQRR